MGTAPNARQIILKVWCAISDAIRVKSVNTLIDFAFDDAVLDDTGTNSDKWTYYNNAVQVAQIIVEYKSSCKIDIVRAYRV